MKLPNFFGWELRIEKPRSQKKNVYEDRFYPSSTNWDRSYKSGKSQIDVYDQVAWVAIAIDCIYEDIVSRNAFFVDPKTQEYIDEDRLPEELITPIYNGFANLDFMQLIGIMVAHKRLTGNAILLKMQKSLYGATNKMVEQFGYLPPGKFKAVEDSKGMMLKGYNLTFKDGSMAIAQPDQVIHFSQNNLESPFWGIGDIQKIRLTVEGQIAATEYNNEFMGNKASPSLAVTSEEEMDEDEFKRYQKMLEAKYEGKRNAGRIMLLNGKNVKVQEFSLSPADIQFIEKERYSRQTILSIHRVPPVRAGVPDNANRAISDQQLVQYYKGVNSELEYLAKVINHQFVRQLDPTMTKYFELKFSKWSTAEVDRIATMIQNGMISPNRASEMIGEEADWADETRSAFYIGMGLVPMGEAGQMALPPKMDDMKPYPNEHAARLEEPGKYDRFRRENDFFYKKSKKDKDKGIDVIWGIILKPKPKTQMQSLRFDAKRFTVKDAKAWLSAHNISPIAFEPAKAQEGEEQKEPDLNNPKNVEEIVEYFYGEKGKYRPKKFQAEYLRASLRTRSEVENIYTPMIGRFFKAQMNRAVKAFRELYGKSDNVKTGESAKLIIDLEFEDEELAKEMRKLHSSAIQRSIGNINRITASNVESSLSNPYVASMIVELGKKLKDFAVNGHTRDELMEIIKDGFDQSQNINEIQKAIEDKFEQYQGYRARVIARTESRIAYDAGAKISYTELAVQTVDVVGCTQFEPDSDCGRQGIPIHEIDKLTFHCNHIGTLVPSKEINS